MADPRSRRQWQPVPTQDIVRPGTAWHERQLAHLIPDSTALAKALLLLVVPAVITSMVPGGLPVLLVILAIAAILTAGFAVSRDVLIEGPRWRHRGTPITGEPLALLADVQARFEYAREVLKTVPNGPQWKDIKPHAQALLWNAAEHAALVGPLDAELGALQLAGTGTPQMALERSLQERRVEHYGVIRRAQQEADMLVQAAADASAAARVALQATGSMHALELVAPSRPAIEALSGITDARERLRQLVDVWTELDESTLLLQEKLGGELPQEGSGSAATTS